MDIFIPVDHSMESAHRVMDDPKRLCAEDASRGRHVNARAKAKAAPPSASDVYFTHTGQLMDDEGLSRAQAMRRIAIEKPTVHAAYIQEFNEVAKAKAAAQAEAASVARRRRNRR